MGAAVATIAAELAVLAYQVFAVRGELDLRANLMGALPFVFIGIGMAALMRGVALLLGGHAPSVMGVLVEFCVAAVFYLLVSFAWCRLTHNDDFAHVLPRFATRSEEGNEA